MLEISHEDRLILKTVDHTLLGQTATWEDILGICHEGIQFGVASVCIPPSYVERAVNYVAGKIPVCTVIGFPNGYNTTQVKVFETKVAVEQGAAEIDMVVNLGDVRQGHYEAVLQEIKAVRQACPDSILKVIIETCLLAEEEKIRLCQVVTDSGADFIKTSTGFSHAGANLEDIQLFKRYIGKNLKIKAAGGISTLDDARQFLAAGASRLGTSRIVKLIKKEHGDGY